jgi:hypothetical protein
MKFFSWMMEPSLFAPSCAMKLGRSLAIKILLGLIAKLKYHLY